MVGDDGTMLDLARPEHDGVVVVDSHSKPSAARVILEHLRDPAAALQACRRALKTRGILWIATPNLDSEGHRIFREHWIHLQPPRHAVIYTPGSLSRLLADSSFEVVALRASRQARWSFRMSSALAQDTPPFDAFECVTDKWRLLQRAVFVIDREDRIVYADYVADQMT